MIPLKKMKSLRESVTDLLRKEDKKANPEKDLFLIEKKVNQEIEEASLTVQTGLSLLVRRDIKKSIKRDLLAKENCSSLLMIVEVIAINILKTNRITKWPNIMGIIL